MSNLLSARVFSLVFGIGYTITVLGNFPLFRYYPAVGRFSWVDLADKTLGPAMSWFGWMAYAAIPAVILAAIVPRKIADKIPAVVFWLIPLAIFVGGFYRELEWFVK